MWRAPLRWAGPPTQLPLLVPELDRLLSRQLLTPFEQRHRLARDHLPQRHFQRLAPAVIPERLEVQHLPAITDPALARRERRALLLVTNVHRPRLCSGHLWRPALLPCHVIGPALAAADKVLAVGDQALVQLAGQQWDAVRPGVITEPMAGHADLAAAGLEQHALIEVMPLLYRGFELGDHGRWPRERDAHEPLQMGTPVLAQVGGNAGGVGTGAVGEQLPG